MNQPIPHHIIEVAVPYDGPSDLLGGSNWKGFNAGLYIGYWDLSQGGTQIVSLPLGNVQLAAAFEPLTLPQDLPHVRITSPVAGGGPYEVGPLTVTAQVTDDAFGTTTISWTVDGLTQGSAGTTMSFTPTTAGDHVVEVTVLDADSHVASALLTIEFIPKEVAPTITAINPGAGVVTLDEDEILAFEATYRDDNLGQGLDVLTGTWTVDSLAVSPATVAVTTIDGSTRKSTFTYHPGFTDSGSHQVRFEVVDSYLDRNMTASTTWPVTVTNINRAPTITSPMPPGAALTILEGEPVAFSIVAGDPDGVTGLKIRWTVDGIPWPSSDDQQAITFTTKFDSAGSHAVKVVVSDTQLTSDRVWTVSVMDVDRPPVITAAEPAEVEAEVAEGQTLALSVEATDPDTDNGIHYVWSVDGFVLANATGANLSYSPSFTTVTNANTLLQTISVEVYDNATPPQHTGRTWDVLVRDTDRPPQIVVMGIPADGQLPLGASLRVNALESIDPDGDALAFTWSFAGERSIKGVSADWMAAEVGGNAIDLTVISRHNGKEVTTTWHSEVEVVAPELTLQGLVLSPAAGFIDGQTVTLTFTIRNDGKLPLPQISIDVLLDGTKVDTIVLRDAVDADGGTHAFSYEWVAVRGLHSLAFSIPPGDGYEVRTDRVEAKGLRVSPPTHGPDLGGGKGGLTLALGLIGLVAVILVALVLVRRRRRATTPSSGTAALPAPPPPPPSYQSRAGPPPTRAMPPPPAALPPPPPPSYAARAAAASAAAAARPTGATAGTAASSEGYALEDIFLIHTDGRLIVHNAYSEAERVDEQIMSSMLAAITAVITDSLRREGALESMRYGEYTILFHQETNFALAVVIRGKETDRLRADLAEIGRSVGRDYGGVLDPWDGQTATFKGVPRYFAALEAGSIKVLGASGEKAEQVRILSAVEFFQGFVRMKVAVKNTTETIITDGQLKILYDRTALRLDHVEPDYELDGSEVLLGNVAPGEKKTVAFYLDPMICMESTVDGILTFKDAKGKLAHVEMKRRAVDIACPIFYTKQTINLAMLKRLVADSSYNDSKVYQVPRGIPWPEALEIAKESVGGHDVRPVRTFEETTPSFVGEAWYYGAAQNTNEEIVIRATVRESTGTLELFVACSNLASLTGLLAELGHGLNHVLVRRRGKEGGKTAMVTDPAIKDELARASSLLDRMSEGQAASEDARLMGAVALDDLED